MRITELMAVGVGGFVGANLRFGLVKLLPTAAFPFSTLAANVIAGFVIGLIIGLDDTPFALPPKWKLFVNTGLLGGLSTFSTFSLETVKLYQDGKIGLAGVNALLNLALSIIGVAAGMAVVKAARKA